LGHEQYDLDDLATTNSVTCRQKRLASLMTNKCRSIGCQCRTRTDQ